MLGLSGKHKRLIFGAALVLGLCLSWFTVYPTVYAAPLDSSNQSTANQNGNSTQTTNNTADSGTTCAIEKLGWILCPIIETAGKVGDKAFSLLSNNFLQTEPELVASFNGGANKPGTYVAWEFARNIANIMFIIAFLIIIMSQVTGRGINNYGIKKLLPKLVVAAIAVNVSYYICQLMVDLTNILGFEIKNFMIQTAQGVTTSVVMPPQTGIDNQTSNGFLGTVAVAILGLAGVVWFLLPVLFLGVSTVVIASLVIIVILLMRKAFIVLLVVLSPIAFVFYLLPNTERLFQKWLSMFWQLLLVFPVVALLFGGGQLASSIILVAGTSTKADSAYGDGSDKCIQLSQAQKSTNDKPTTYTQPEPGNCIKQGNQRSVPFMLGLVAAGIAVAPLFAVWSVLKGALSAAGAIGGKISGAVQSAGNKANGYAKRPEDWLRKRAGENIQTKWQNMQSRGLNSEGGALTRAAGRRARSRAMRERTLQLAKSDLERSQNQELASILADPQKSREMTSGLSQQGQEAARMGATASQRDAISKEIAAARLEVSNLKVGTGDISNDAALQAQAEIDTGNFDSPHLAALLEQVAKINQQAFMGLATQVSQKAGRETTVTRTASEVMAGMNGLYGGSDIAAMKRGDTKDSQGNAIDWRTVARANLSKSGISSNNIASLSNDGVDTITSLVNEELAAGNTNARDNVRVANAGLSADQRGNLTQEKQQKLNNI